MNSRAGCLNFASPLRVVVARMSESDGGAKPAFTTTAQPTCVQPARRPHPHILRETWHDHDHDHDHTHHSTSTRLSTHAHVSRHCYVFKDAVPPLPVEHRGSQTPRLHPRWDGPTQRPPPPRTTPSPHLDSPGLSLCRAWAAHGGSTGWVGNPTTSTGHRRRQSWYPAYTRTNRPDRHLLMHTPHHQVIILAVAHHEPTGRGPVHDIHVALRVHAADVAGAKPQLAGTVMEEHLCCLLRLPPVP